MTEEAYKEQLEQLREKYRLADSDEKRKAIIKKAEEFKYAWSEIGADGERKHPIDYMQKRLKQLAQEKILRQGRLPVGCE